MTPDGLPVIDANSGPDGLVIVTGLSGHGFTLGPAFGETAADLAVEGRTNRDSRRLRSPALPADGYRRQQ